ncbi:MAG: hypothetical protein JSS30_03975 [Verrucomicrobia bacterium]|nr:hypothetical protein [Verrucomicrobiota bacterium]
MEYSLTNGIGRVTGGLTTFFLNRFVTATPFPSETITKAEKSILQFKKSIHYVNGLRIGKKHLRKDKWGSWFVQTALSFSPFVALEKAARHAANKVQVFVTRKPVSIKDSSGFKEIEAEFKTAKIFTEVLKDKKEQVDKLRKQGKDGTNVDTRIKRFYTDLEKLLISKLPASSSAPSVNDAVGFGVQWATQLGLTWWARLSVYYFVTGCIPDHIIGKVAKTALFLGTAYVYSQGLAWYGRTQDEAIRTEAGKDKTDCLKYLDKKTIDEIRDLAFDKLLFDQELKDKHSEKLEELKTKLTEISTADDNADEKDLDDDAGYDSPRTVRDDGVRKRKKKEKVAKDDDDTAVLADPAPRAPLLRGGGGGGGRGAPVPPASALRDPRALFGRVEPTVAPTDTHTGASSYDRPRPPLATRIVGERPEARTLLQAPHYLYLLVGGERTAQAHIEYLYNSYEKDVLDLPPNAYVDEFGRQIAILKTFVNRATAEGNYDFNAILNGMMQQIAAYINDIRNPVDRDGLEHRSEKKETSRRLNFGDDTPGKGAPGMIPVDEVHGVVPSFLVSPEASVHRVKVDETRDDASLGSAVFSSVKKEPEKDKDDN